MGIKSLLCSHRCDREVPVWCGCRSLILAGELQKNAESVAAGVFVDSGFETFVKILLENFSDFLNLFFQVCRDRLYEFDSGRFSWNPFSELRYRLCFFILNGNSCFLKKEDCLKKTALENHFLRILIDNLGTYMCYTKLLPYNNFLFERSKAEYNRYFASL